MFNKVYDLVEKYQAPVLAASTVTLGCCLFISINKLVEAHSVIAQVEASLDELGLTEQVVEHIKNRKT